MKNMYRADIARIAEETVINLKNLETSLEVLRSDLAVLCNSIGHPAAANMALSRNVGPSAFNQAAWGAAPYAASAFASSWPNMAGAPSFASPGYGPIYATNAPNYVAFGTPFASAPSPYLSTAFASPIGATGYPITPAFR